MIMANIVDLNEYLLKNKLCSRCDYIYDDNNMLKYTLRDNTEKIIINDQNLPSKIFINDTLESEIIYDKLARPLYINDINGNCKCKYEYIDFDNGGYKKIRNINIKLKTFKEIYEYDKLDRIINMKLPSYANGKIITDEYSFEYNGNSDRIHKIYLNCNLLTEYAYSTECNNNEKIKIVYSNDILDSRNVYDDKNNLIISETQNEYKKIFYNEFNKIKYTLTYYKNTYLKEKISIIN